MDGFGGDDFDDAVGEMAVSALFPLLYSLLHPFLYVFAFSAFFY